MPNGHTATAFRLLFLSYRAVAAPADAKLEALEGKNDLVGLLREQEMVPDWTCAPLRFHIYLARRMLSFERGFESKTK
jgi:hypothetical protein